MPKPNYVSKRKAIAQRQATNKAKLADAKERVLTMLRSGITVAEAMEGVGRSRERFYEWCKIDAEFSRRADSARRQSGDGPKPPSGFVNFRKEYFGLDTYWHHKDIARHLEGQPGGSITLVLIPPAWGKTTLMEDWICYVLAQIDRSHRFCVISAGANQATKMLGRIKTRMTDRVRFPGYVVDFGPFRAADREHELPWNATFVRIVGVSQDDRDYSIEAKGAGARIYGARFDTIIMDDCQELVRGQLSPSTDSLIEYFRGMVLTRPGKSGRIFIVGTRIAPGDFYERLVDEGIVDELVLIRALDDKGHSNFPPVIDPATGERLVAENGDPLGWTEEELEARRAKVGDEMWARVYMQQPTSRSTATFTEEMIERALDRDRGIATHEAANQRGVDRVCSLDPALGGKTALLAASYDRGHLWLHEAYDEGGLARFEDIWELVARMSGKWRPSTWVVERNSLQKGLARDDRLRDMGRRYGFYIQEHKTDGDKTDPLIGIPSMAGAFLRREIRIPWGSEQARKAFAPLVDQLRAWRPDVPAKFLRQDQVMALWFAYLFWNRRRDTIRQASDAWRRTGMPYEATDYRSRYLVGA